MGCAGACSLSTGLETGGDLEGVVDVPLETGEGTDHNDTGTETVPESLEADFFVDGLDLFAGGALGVGSLVEDGDHGVSGVGDDSAEDTSDLTGSESDTELGGLGVVVSASGEDVGVESSDDLLEGDELNNCVGNLTAPEGGETLVESVPAFVLHDLVPAGNSGGGEGSGGGGLHSDLELYSINTYGN